VFLQTSSTASVTTITSNVTSIVTAAASWIETYVGVIMDNPLILTFVVLSMAGMGVGLIRRMIRL
jgi:hypothetical protein